MKRVLATICILQLAVCMFAGLTFNEKAQTIRALLPKVEQASGYHFFYNSSLTGLDKQVTLQVNDAELVSVLNILFEGSGIEYKITGNQVIALTNQEINELGASTAVTGVVYDENNEPIIGATVMIKHTTVGTVTDFDGQFALDNVKAGQYLVASYMGYEPYELRVTDKANNYKIVLKEATQGLDEVVVVGYGTQKKVNLTGAVSTIDSRNIVGRPTASLATTLQGADPSLNIAIGSGAPNSSVSLNIRGASSISGSTTPLVLVDGVEMDLSRVNANDVESVSVLKDASAAAIYGAKASAGVILITTKTGKDGLAPQITLDVKAGWKNPTTEHDFITQGFWSAYLSDVSMRLHTKYAMTTYTEADYAELWMRLDDVTEDPERPWTVVQSGGNYKYYANYDWYNHYFKKNRPMQDYNVSLRGGNEKVNYYVSGRYYGEDGMYAQNTDHLDQFSTRAKVNVNIKKWLHYGVNFSFFSGNYTYPGTESSRELFRVGSLHAMAFIPSTNPDGTSVYMNPYIYSGSGTVGDGVNALLNYGKHTNNQKNREMMIQNSLTFDLAKNLTLNGDYSFTWRTKEISNRSVKVPYSSSVGQISYIDNFRSVDTYHQQIARYQTHMYNAYIKWDPTWDQHHLSVAAGYNGQMYRYHSLEATRADMMTEDLNSFNFATGEVTDLSESIKTYATNGFFGRFNYDFAGRYLFEFSIRADASSRFAKGYRWGVAPAGSVGWRMSEEEFWKPISGWWTNSKLRFSAGQLGNQQVSGYYDYIQSIATDGVFTQSITLDGTSLLTYATESDVNSKSLTWEKITTYDVGLDLGFFRNRLNFTGDFYVRNTTGMISAGSQMPAVYGAAQPEENNADMRTIGWELALGWRDSKKLGGHDFKYEVSAGVGDYQSKITRFSNPTGTLSDYYEGMTMGEIWGYEIDGLFQNWDEVNDYLTKVVPLGNTIVYTDIMGETASSAPGLHPGDVRYVDLNGDGYINSGDNTVSNPGDRKIIGNKLPRYSYNFRAGIEYFGFDFSIFFQGVGKRDWYPATEATTFWGPYSRPYQGFMEKNLMQNVWTEDNPDGYFPLFRAYEALGSANSLGPVNTRYLQSIAYLRLKNITVGYTLPCWKKVFSQFHIYFSAENPWYYSPLQKYCRSIDPESCASIAQGITYNFSKTFTFGITATF